MATLIERQIDDWEKRGVIDAQVARTLRGDITAGLAHGRPGGSPARHFSFFQVVTFFAAISLGAAVLIFVASNWEYIPRLVRTAGVMTLIAAGYLGGAFVHRRYGARRWPIEEGCYVVGGAAFIGGVALVAQMYHLSGDSRDAALIYSVALGLSGFAVRSVALVLVAAGWITWWQVTGPQADTILSSQFVLFAAAIAAGTAFASLRKAVWLRRALYLAGLIGLLPIVANYLIELLDFLADVYDAIPQTVRVTGWLAILGLAAAALIAGRFLPGLANRLAAASAKRAGAQFGIGLVAIAFLHGELDSDAGLVIVASLAVIFVLVALYAHGRDRRAIRYISYAVFVGEILVVYGETVYSMLGTSGFFLALGLVLALIAFAVYRLERLWKARKARESTDA